MSARTANQPGTGVEVIAQDLWRIGRRARRGLLRAFSSRAYRTVAILDVAREYDMVARSDEQYYARQYLYFIEQRLSKGPCDILDLGCGQGRLSLPLAAAGHNVVGVDFSPDAIASAQAYARNMQHAPLFKTGDLLEYLYQFPAGKLDCVVCTEVLYMVADTAAVLNQIARVLRPGGLAFLGFRTKFYYLLHFLQRKDFQKIPLIMNQSSGRLFGMDFHWYSPEEARAALEGCGLSRIQCYGIGILSGAENDPLELICRPAKLDPGEQATLLDAELKLATDYAGCGRYLLAIGEKG